MRTEKKARASRRRPSESRCSTSSLKVPVGSFSLDCSDKEFHAASFANCHHALARPCGSDAVLFCCGASWGRKTAATETRLPRALLVFFLLAQKGGKKRRTRLLSQSASARLGSRLAGARSLGSLDELSFCLFTAATRSILLSNCRFMRAVSLLCCRRER